MMLSGIPGKPGEFAAKTVDSLRTTIRTKKGRSVAGAVLGAVALTGTLIAVGANASANDSAKQQAAAAETARIAAAQASASSSSASAAAASESSAAAAAAASASSSSASAAAKAAADKAAADAAAKAAADRASASAAANRDEQRTPVPTSDPTTTKPSPRPTTTKPSSSPSTQSYAPVAPGSARAIAQQMIPADQFGCFDWIIERESGWDVHASNPSGAYGLPQALPGSKMASAGSDWHDNPATQIKWALSYMDSRYGSPCGAQSFWKSHGWY